MAKRTPATQTGEIAANYVRNVFTLMNWNANPTQNDLGIDLYVEACDEAGTLLPWRFAVQVKGASKIRSVNRSPVYRVDAPHVRDWASADLPVLFILCHVKGHRVAAAFSLWVDKFVCGSLGWPVGDDSFVPPRTVSLRLPVDERFNEGCRDRLLEYLKGWSPIGRAEGGITGYLTHVSEQVIQRYTIQEETFRWSLDALPIRYRCMAQGQAKDVADGVHELLARGRRRITLLGKPATGKTTSLNRILAHPPERLIPVSIREIVPTSPEEVHDHVCSALRIGNQRHARYLQVQGRLLLLVDGLSEMGHYPEIMENIIQLSSKMKETRFVIASRTAEYQQIRHRQAFEEWEIMDLDQESQDAFVSEQPPETEAAVLSAFRAQPELRRECGNQFLFLIAVKLIPCLQGKALRRANLYEEFLARYLRWVQVHRLESAKIMELLSRIAFAMRGPSSPRKTISNSVLTQLLKKECGIRDAEVVRRMLYAHGLIEKRGRRSGFFQDTLQEYLCAKWLILKGVFPSMLDTSQGRLYYQGVELNDMIRSFYIELGGFEVIAAQGCRNGGVPGQEHGTEHTAR